MVYPIQRFSSVSPMSAPEGLNVSWFHSNSIQVINDIYNNGWSPETRPGIIYGTAVYLCSIKWDDREAYLECKLNVTPNEVKDFGHGNQNDLIAYLRENGVKADRTSRAGSSSHNIAIRDYFLDSGIKVVKFFEYNFEVIAVYDPNCLFVVNKDVWKV